MLWLGIVIMVAVFVFAIGWLAWLYCIPHRYKNPPGSSLTVTTQYRSGEAPPANVPNHTTITTFPPEGGAIGGQNPGFNLPPDTSLATGAPYVVGPYPTPAAAPVGAPHIMGPYPIPTAGPSPYPSDGAFSAPGGSYPAPYPSSGGSYPTNERPYPMPMVPPYSGGAGYPATGSGLPYPGADGSYPMNMPTYPGGVDSKNDLGAPRGPPAYHPDALPDYKFSS